MDSMAPPFRRPMSDWLALRTSPSKPAWAVRSYRPSWSALPLAAHSCNFRRNKDVKIASRTQPAPAGKGWLSSLRTALKWRRCAALFHSSCEHMQ